MSQENLNLRFRAMGREYLGISNLSPRDADIFYVVCGELGTRDFVQHGFIWVVHASISQNTVYELHDMFYEYEAHVLGKRVWRRDGLWISVV